MQRYKLVDLYFEPEHWNPRAYCNIPECWVGIVSSNDNTYRILRDTREEVLESASADGVLIPTSFK